MGSNYKVTEDGKIWSYISNKYLRVWKDKKGYIYVTIIENGKKINKSVHRLVAEAFIPNPDNKPEVNHINADKTDNRVENLEWCTRQENVTHGKTSGLIPRGEKNGQSKLTQSQVDEIRIKRSTHSLAELANEYCVSRATISRICNGKQWI